MCVCVCVRVCVRGGKRMYVLGCSVTLVVKMCCTRNHLHNFYFCRIMAARQQIDCFQFRKTSFASYAPHANVSPS